MADQINYIENKGAVVVGNFKILTLNDSLICLKSQKNLIQIEGENLSLKTISNTVSTPLFGQNVVMLTMIACAIILLAILFIIILLYYLFSLHVVKLFYIPARFVERRLIFLLLYSLAKVKSTLLQSSGRSDMLLFAISGRRSSSHCTLVSFTR